MNGRSSKPVWSPKPCGYSGKPANKRSDEMSGRYALAVLELMVELPTLAPTEMDDELERLGNELIRAYDLARDAVVRAYGLGYTPARIAGLMRLRLGTVVAVIEEIEGVTSNGQGWTGW